MIGLIKYLDFEMTSNNFHFSHQFCERKKVSPFFVFSWISQISFLIPFLPTVLFYSLTYSYTFINILLVTALQITLCILRLLKSSIN